MTPAELRALLAKANEPGPTEYREDFGDGEVTTHLTERGKARYRLPGEAARALPALLDVVEAAESIATMAESVPAWAASPNLIALRAALAKLETP